MRFALPDMFLVQENDAAIVVQDPADETRGFSGERLIEILTD